MLADSFGRVATDMRVSLTDRCNLRCAYCMPAEGLDWLPNPELLTDDEVVRLVRIGVELLGIREIRFTGGEPLLRRGLTGIVERTARAAAPSGTVHYDQRHRPGPHRPGAAATPAWTGSTSRSTRCDPRPFRELARRDRLAEVLDGMAAAAAAGLVPVKVNSRAHAGRQRRGGRGTCCGSASPTGTSCGSSSRCRWTPSTAGAAANMVTAEEILDHAQRGVRAQARRLGRARLAPRRRGSLVDGGPATGRRDRLGDQAVLRSLRPGPAHRRRPGAQLPVRPRGKRPARAAAGRCRVTRNWRLAGTAPWRPSCPATASTTPRSCSPTGPCRPSAGESVP